jgi:hypothetical protein
MMKEVESTLNNKGHELPGKTYGKYGGRIAEFPPMEIQYIL